MHRREFRPFIGLALGLIISIGIGYSDPSWSRGAKPAPVTEPVVPVKRVDDPGCKNCVSQAASMFARGQIKEATTQLREWSPKCPNSAQLHILFSTILLSTGANQEAEQQAGMAAELNPTSIAAHLQHALALTALDKKLQAIKEFERVVEIDPACYEAWVALTSAYRQMHEDEKAADAAAKAADLEPGSKAVRMGTLMNLKRSGKFAEARTEIKRLLALPTTSPEFAEELARESLLVGGYDEATEATEKVIAAHPKSVAPLMVNALAHYCQNNFEACIEDASKITQLEPRNTDAVALRALALAKANRVAEAETALSEASAEPNATLYLLTKGNIEAARNNFPGAEEALQSCLTYDQGNNAMQGIPHSLARLALAEVYKRQGKSSLVAEQVQALSRDRRFSSAAAAIQK